jgi:DNA modification methylase
VKQNGAIAASSAAAAANRPPRNALGDFGARGEFVPFKGEMEAWDCVEGCPVAVLEEQKEGASRYYKTFGYQAKPSRSERDFGCERLPSKTAGEATEREDGSDGLKSPRAGAGRTSKDGVRNHHATVKSLDFMRYCVKLVTPAGGVVGDIFLGSGTTGMAAILEGFDFIGIEREEEYLHIAKARIEAVLAKGAP